MQELKDLTYEELKHLVDKYREELLRLRHERARKRLDNPLRLRWLRRMIARINTILREYDLKIRK